MHDFRKLDVWKKSRVLVREIYTLTAGFPREERLGLSSQMQRAAVSVLSNIAEGCGRDSRGDFIRFLKIASGSLAELQAQLYVSCDLNYLQEERMDRMQQLCEEIGKMIFGLRKSVQRQ